MNVLVFKTSVETTEHVMNLAPALDSLAGQGSWNFDLTDCDQILRIVSETIKPEAAMNVLSTNGFMCAELED